MFIACKESSEKKKIDSDDLKPHALNPIYAKGFTIFENSEKIVLTCRNPEDSTKIYAEYIFQKSLDGKNLIPIPVQSVCITSTTHSFLFDLLNANGCIKGMSGINYLKDSTIVSTYKANGVVEIGSDEQINREKVVELQPQLIMVYPYDGADFSAYEKAGIPVLYNAEYLELHPLGKAEWLKVVALLTGNTKEAIQHFNAISKRYNDLTASVKKKTKPTVLLGKPIDNNWFVPGNSSFAAQLIRDAGASYVYEKVEGNNVQTKSIESILTEASQADYWVFTDYDTQEITKDRLKQSNKSFQHLEAFKNDNVVACNAYQIDFFGKAVVEPDVLLHDLIQHFHNTDSTYLPVYFKKVGT